MKTTDEKLTLLLQGLTRQGWPEDKAREMLDAACDVLQAPLAGMPGFVARCTAQAPISANAVLLHVIHTAILLRSVQGCMYLAQAGLLASEHLKEWAEAAALADTTGQPGS